MPFPDLFFHELTHLLLTLLAGGITWLLFLRDTNKCKKTALTLIGAFLGEFLLDIDHLFDYVIAFGTHFRLDYFLAGKMFTTLQKTYVPLHAWEWVILLAIIIYFIKNHSWKVFLTALTLGMFFHLIYDTWFNHITLFGYSLIYRLLHNFDAKYFSTSHN